MSPQLPSSSVSGKIGPVWLSWPCWRIDSALADSRLYGWRTAFVRWQKLTVGAGSGAGASTVVSAAVVSGASEGTVVDVDGPAVPVVAGAMVVDPVVGAVVAATVVGGVVVPWACTEPEASTTTRAAHDSEPTIAGVSSARVGARRVSHLHLPPSRQPRGCPETHSTGAATEEREPLFQGSPRGPSPRATIISR